MEINGYLCIQTCVNCTSLFTRGYVLCWKDTKAQWCLIWGCHPIRLCCSRLWSFVLSIALHPILAADSWLIWLLCESSNQKSRIVLLPQRFIGHYCHLAITNDIGNDIVFLLTASTVISIDCVLAQSRPVLDALINVVEEISSSPVRFVSPAMGSKRNWQWYLNTPRVCVLLRAHLQWRLYLWCVNSEYILIASFYPRHAEAHNTHTHSSAQTELAGLLGN